MSKRREFHSLLNRLTPTILDTLEDLVDEEEQRILNYVYQEWDWTAARHVARVFVDHSLERVNQVRIIGE